MTDAWTIHAGAVAGESAWWQPGWVTVDDGRIADAGPGEPRSDRPVWRLPRLTVLPGFIDVHVHGADGCETMDADPDGLARMAAFVSRHGTTSLLPTTWAADPATTLRAVETVRAAVGPSPQGAEILGVHLEGPWLSPERPGAQDPDGLRAPDRDEIARLIATGAVRRVTLAPELPGAAWAIDAFRDAGASVSIGHTEATMAQAREAVAAGVDSATHAFNAMRPLHHREPGTVAAVLLDDSVVAEVIADQVHLQPAVLELVHRLKGADGMALITDAVRAAGRPDGTVTLGERSATKADGAVRLGDGSLAGSVLTQDVALRNLCEATGGAVEALWPATSRTPARLAGVSARKGAIRSGFDADLTLLDDGGAVAATIVNGRAVHRTDGLPPVPTPVEVA